MEAQVSKNGVELNNGLDIADFLSQYIQHKSYSGDEVEAGQFIRSVCENEGLYITQMGSAPGNFNFAASLFPLDYKKPNIIFLNHIDVVHEGNLKDWTHKPFSGTVKDGEIWGRGSYDNKGMAAMQLFSILKFADTFRSDELPFNVTLLCVSCEETQCNGGAQYVVNNYLEELQAVVVLGEGAPLLDSILQSDPSKKISGISLAHKAVLWLKLESNIQVSGHGSVTPTKYANQEMIKALHLLTKKNSPFILDDVNIQILKRLGELEKGIKGVVLRHPKTFKRLIARKMKTQPELYSLFSNSITLTNIENHNEVFNKIPMQAIAYLDCRLLPEHDKDEFINDIRRTIKNDAISISTMKYIPSQNISNTGTKYYQALEKVLKLNHPQCEVIPIILPNINDCGVFRSAGIQAYATNLYDIDRKYLHAIHNVNERIPIKALNQGVEIYYDFLIELEFNLISNL